MKKEIWEELKQELTASSYGTINETGQKYLKADAVIERLNFATEGNWSHRIVSTDIVNEQILVLVEVVVEGVCHQDFGSSAIKKDIGSAAKIAVKDAIRRIGEEYFEIGANLEKGNEKENEKEDEKKADTEQDESKKCEDCGKGVNQAIIDFCSKFSDTFEKKVVCPGCQKKYKNQK